MQDASSRSDWPRRAAGIFTLLVVLVLVLTSYAAASDLLRSSDPGQGGQRGESLSAIPGRSPDPTVDSRLSVPATSATVGTRDQRAVSNSISERKDATSLPANQSAAGAIDTGDPTADDGYIVDGETLSPFDDHPAILNLDPDLRTAIRHAATDAKADGVEMVINSGWRSKRYQQSLLDEAIVTYGSEKEARKWVNTPEKSTHVTGDAVDVGYTDADYWLIQHGSDYGLCQIYANEIWHFELAVEPGDTCPAPISDATAG